MVALSTMEIEYKIAIKATNLVGKLVGNLFFLFLNGSLCFRMPHIWLS